MQLKSTPTAYRAKKFSCFIAVTILSVFFLAVCPNIEGITLYELADYGSECTGGWLNPDLIVAVILAESGGNPYAININGVGSFYPSSYEEAVELIYGYNRANVDIGLMQVNYLSWGGVTGLGPEEFFDPWINVCVGSQILAHYIRQNGYPGIGRYNAISPAKQVKYIRKVERVYAELVAGRKNKDSAKRF